ncbi:MAG: DUF4177 domain-containing protein [Synergistaceae bacterium]|nr:DUF4177 domain-containing protein [Synergistaceae bacterium]
MKKALLTVVLAVLMSVCAFTGTSAFAGAKYEYKVVPLGSLTSLQKSKGAAAKTAEVEELLNKWGAEGWEISEIFAVRTTFDPNVFFVIMKREL